MGVFTVSEPEVLTGGVSVAITEKDNIEIINTGVISRAINILFIVSSKYNNISTISTPLIYKILNNVSMIFV
jgi:hypothetical protein